MTIEVPDVLGQRLQRLAREAGFTTVPEFFAEYFAPLETGVPAEQLELLLEESRGGPYLDVNEAFWKDLRSDLAERLAARAPS
jgi:hypothetical protein